MKELIESEIKAIKSYRNYNEFTLQNIIKKYVNEELFKKLIDYENKLNHSEMDAMENYIKPKQA